MKINEEIRIDQEDSGRVDKFLADNFADFPRMFWKKAIENGEVEVNDRKIKPNYKLRVGDKVVVNVKIINREITLAPDENISFEIVHQNKDFIIIDKPAGISVHPSENEKSGTLANGLLAKFPQIKDVGEDKIRPGIVHRLDKETSGLMIIALNQKAFEFFKEAFKGKKIEKKYTALVWGEIKKEQGQIRGFIGKSKSNPTRQSFSQESSKVDNPKESQTQYRVIKKIKGKTLVELSPKTGRMHQLRVHLHSVGHPIVGDKKYSNKKTKNKNKKHPRHLLHAGYLRFELWDGQEHCYQSPLPKDFEKRS